MSNNNLYWGRRYGNTQPIPDRMKASAAITIEHVFLVPKGSGMAGQSNSGPRGSRRTRFYAGRLTKKGYGK